MRIAVETGGFTSAADACRTGNQISALQCESLAGKLGGYAGMAGDDATSADFAASYDEGARQALDTLAELTHAYIGLGRLLTATGTNHRDAEAASAAVSAYSGGSLDEDDYVRVSPASPPSCLGANPVSLGTVETFILDHIEGFVWPGADTDLLLDAAATWRRAGAGVADLESHCDIAAGFLEHQVSPEIPLALSALAELRSLIGDTADALVSVGTSCEEYADAVRDTHDRTRALLTEIGQMVVEGAVISAIVGGITGGLGAGAAGSAALARIGAQAPRFHALLVGLRATGTATAGRLRTAGDGLRTVRTRVEKFARVPARGERGSMKVPGGWGGARGIPARPRPDVTDEKLNNYVSNLFKGTKNDSRVGDGTTMDAIRAESATGEATHGRMHAIKGRETLRGLERWLRQNPDASGPDRQVAESLINELKDVLTP
ncbi:hypothetical protein ASG88_08790 [Nocardioides sp. Soil777]|uniref:hypothetical protein n=1 Tax=Nocardioides sp. Soil777 TaxID=1736409 RepID=UPI0007033E4F|nr:hypothetical protein [Nocardioides sp. Soil777]KRF01544.1 hypothetical protein ASG88_08790 [Nocardioides sp. Soil777]